MLGVTMKCPAFIDFGGSSSIWLHDNVIKVTSDVLTASFYDFVIGSKIKSGFSEIRELDTPEISEFTFSLDKVKKLYNIDSMEQDYKEKIFSFMLAPSSIDNFRFFEMPYYDEFDDELINSIDSWYNDRSCVWHKNVKWPESKSQIIDTINRIPSHFSRKICPDQTIKNLIRFVNSCKWPLSLDMSNGNILLNNNGQAIFNDMFTS
jgi:hypothetical protein